MSKVLTDRGQRADDCVSPCSMDPANPPRFTEPLHPFPLPPLHHASQHQTNPGQPGSPTRRLRFRLYSLPDADVTVSSYVSTLSSGPAQRRWAAGGRSTSRASRLAKRPHWVVSLRDLRSRHTGRHSHPLSGRLSFPLAPGRLTGDRRDRDDAKAAARHGGRGLR